MPLNFVTPKLWVNDDSLFLSHSPIWSNSLSVTQKWYMTPKKRTWSSSNTFIVGTVKEQLIRIPDGLRNSARVARTWTYRQGQVCLKPWIPRLCSKPLHKLGQVTFGDDQAISTSHCVARYFDDLVESIWCYRTVTHVTKILQNLWLTQIRSF